MEITLLDPHAAGEAALAAFTRFSNLKRRERDPEDEPLTVAGMTRNLRHRAPADELRLWVVWDDRQEEIIAAARLEFRHGEDNQHAADFGVDVLPSLRRRGIGSRMLAPVAAAAGSAGRRLLITYTDSEVPAGESFLAALGAEMGLLEQVSQLAMADLDRSRVEAWLGRALELADEFEFGCWEGPYPEEALPEVAEMYRAINHAPRGTLQLDDEVWPPEVIRERDRAMVARGGERWTMYVRERATGRIAGYTSTHWSPNQPTLLQQGDTAVFPEYRRRGIGRWLKAAMIDRVARDRPGVTRVRTDNADSNASMLQINWDMGFKPYKQWRIWQVEVARLHRVLGDRGSR